MDSNRAHSDARFKVGWAAAYPQSLALFFFGDLDFSGMEILRNLRSVFPHARAWQPGYKQLLDLLEAGGGHQPEWASKEGQLDPQATGCEWADAVLLPVIRREGRFVDQEASIGRATAVLLKDPR